MSVTFNNGPSGLNRIKNQDVTRSAKSSPQPKIILVRGLPGSGKSTFAKSLSGYEHIEADMYFEVDGRYVFDSSRVKDSHNWCVRSAHDALLAGKNVVVSNTFIKLWELQRYIDLGFPFQIVEMTGTWPNTHGVSDDKMKLMAGNWEALPTQGLKPQRNATRTKFQGQQIQSRR